MTSVRVESVVVRLSVEKAEVSSLDKAVALAASTDVKCSVEELGKVGEVVWLVMVCFDTAPTDVECVGRLSELTVFTRVVGDAESGDSERVLPGVDGEDASVADDGVTVEI